MADSTKKTEGLIRQARDLADALLSTKLDSDQETLARRILETLKESLTHLTGTRSDTGAESEPIQLDAVVFDVCSLVEDVAGLSADAAHQKHVELVSYVARNYPVWVKGDPKRVRQVLSALVDYAIGASSTGAVVVSVDSIETSGETTTIRFEVRATVQDADAVGRLNEQEINLARQVCRLMGGKSGRDDGAENELVLWFWLPFESCDRAPYSSLTLPVPPVGSWILVVDDNEAARDAVIKELRTARLSVAGASDGATALELLQSAREREQPFQLILIDQEMPAGGNGASLAEKIRGATGKNGDEPPMVLLYRTRLGKPVSSEDQEHFAAALAKPVRRLDMLETVERLLRRKHRRKSSGPIAALSGKEQETPVDLGKVLVAVTNPAVQRVLIRQLKRLGFSTEVAQTGPEAIDTLDQGNYELLLLDLTLPKMDGYQVAVEIRRREGDRPRVPIVAISSSSAAQDRERCLDAGINDLLGTPVTFRDLKRILELLPLARGPTTVTE